MKGHAGARRRRAPFRFSRYRNRDHLNRSVESGDWPTGRYLQAFQSIDVHAAAPRRGMSLAPQFAWTTIVSRLPTPSPSADGDHAANDDELTLEVDALIN